MALLQVDSTLVSKVDLLALVVGAFLTLCFTSAPLKDALAIWPRLCPAEVSDSLRTHEEEVAKVRETHFVPLNVPIHPLRPRPTTLFLIHVVEDVALLLH